MAKYEVEITDELNSTLMEMADSGDITVQELLERILENNIDTAKSNIAVNLYKEGKLKAREAWKLSGLSYQEFQNRAKA